MYYAEGNVYASPEDQCTDCRLKIVGTCPFIRALAEGAVTFSEDEILVTGCGLYDPTKLHVVDANGDEDVKDNVVSFTPEGSDS